MQYKITYTSGETQVIECTTMHITQGLGHLKFLNGRGPSAEVKLFVNANEVRRVEQVQ